MHGPRLARRYGYHVINCGNAQNEIFRRSGDYQRVRLKLIDPVTVQKTPLSAYYDNRYVDEPESRHSSSPWQ